MDRVIGEPSRPRLYVHASFPTTGNVRLCLTSRLIPPASLQACRTALRATLLDPPFRRRKACRMNAADCQVHTQALLWRFLLPHLASPPKLNNPPPIALGGPPSRSGCELRQSFSFGSDLQTQFATDLSFAIERLRYRSRATNVAQQQNLHFEVAAFVGDLQHVANANLASGLGGLLVP